MIAIAVGDPEATRTVYAVVIGLAVIGVVLIGVAIWLIRQTRVDPELLAPLEQMETRRWEKRDPATQRRMLDDVRPEGAEPLHRERPIPALDEEFESELPIVTGFDDLKGGVDLTPEPREDPADEGAVTAAEKAPEEATGEPDDDVADSEEGGVDLVEKSEDTGDDDAPESADGSPDDGDSSPDDGDSSLDDAGDDDRRSAAATVQD